MKYFKIILDEDMLSTVSHALLIYETECLLQRKQFLFEAIRDAREHIDQTAQEIEM